jgi:transcriptional regulator GlxA family with amidase domain
VDGNVITGAGMGAALDFSLALTEVLFGAEKAKALRSAVIAD